MKIRKFRIENWAKIGEIVLLSFGFKKLEEFIPPAPSPLTILNEL